MTGVIESYSRAIAKADNNKIPFSLRSEFTLAEGKNGNVKSLYNKFEKTSQIYKALNSKK